MVVLVYFDWDNSAPKSLCYRFNLMNSFLLID